MPDVYIFIYILQDKFADLHFVGRLQVPGSYFGIELDMILNGKMLLHYRISISVGSF